MPRNLFRFKRPVELDDVQTCDPVADLMGFVIEVATVTFRDVVLKMSVIAS